MDLERSGKYLKKYYFDLSKEELSEARNDHFLNDFEYLERHYFLNLSEIQSSVIDDITDNFYTNKIKPLVSKFKRAENKRILAESFKEISLNMNILFFLVFGENFDDRFNSEVLKSFYSIYIDYMIAIKALLKCFLSDNDITSDEGSAIIVNHRPVIRSEDFLKFYKKEKYVMSDVAGIAEHKELEKALEILEKIEEKDIKKSSYINYKLWLLFKLNRAEEHVDELYHQMIEIESLINKKRGSVFRFYLARFFLRCWFVSRDEKFLLEFKRVFHDSVPFYKGGYFDIQLNDDNSIKRITSLESVYAPYMCAYAFINKESYY